MPSNIGATEHHQFYGTGAGAAAVAVDLSGNANCTAGTDHIYQAAFGFGADCTVMVAIDLESGVTPAGHIFSRYGTGRTLQAIRYDGTTGLQLILDDDPPSHTLTIPSDGEIVVSWSMTADPLDPSNVRSEVRAWDTVTGFSDGISWTHPEPGGLAASDIIWGAQVVAGTNSTGGELRGAGFLLHGTGSVQVQRDRLSAAPAPTLVGDTAMESTVPDRASGFGDQGTLAGQTHYYGSSAVVANHLLLVSPLVNVQWHDTDSISWNALIPPATPELWTLSPDGSSYLGLPWAWRRPVPLVVNKARCRVFVSSGASGSAVENTVSLTVWSFNRNPGVDSVIPLEHYSVTDSFGPVNDTFAGSPGRWIEFDTLRISRTPDGEKTWLCISVEVTGPSASDQDVTIHAVTIDPISEVDTDAIGEVGNG